MNKCPFCPKPCENYWCSYSTEGNSLKIKLSDIAIKKCEDFTKKRCGDIDLYKKRGNFKPEDILAGSMGEYATTLALRRRGIAASLPDFCIYKGRQKSYKADLSCNKNEYHVKSQTTDSRDKYGNSWLLQRTDPMLKDPKDNEYLIFTNVDIDKATVEILGCVKVKDIIDNDLIGECKVNWFRKTKVALYWDDIKEKLSKAKHQSLLRKK